MEKKSSIDASTLSSLDLVANLDGLFAYLEKMIQAAMELSREQIDRL